jgi:hypothetical protein
MAKKAKRYVVITTDSTRRGIFGGYLESYDQDKMIAVLSQARMAVYFSSNCKGVVGLASIGPQKAEPLHEPEIALCEKGLHASFTIEDAKKYAPVNSVLTEVKVWGRIIIDKDKMVATDRMIVREINP